MAFEAKSILINLMGLPQDASDDMILQNTAQFQQELISYKELTDGELVTLTNSQSKLQSDVASLTASNEKLTNSNKSLLETIVNHDLTQYKDVIKNEADVKAMLLNDRESGLKMLNSLKLATSAPVVAPVAKPAPLHNASTAAQPAPIVNGGATQTTPEFAIKVTNRARELQNSSKGMGWNQAFLNARAEIESELQNA